MVSISNSNSNRTSAPSWSYAMRFTPRVRNILMAVNIAAWLIYFVTERETIIYEPEVPVVLSGSAPPGGKEIELSQRSVEDPTISSTEDFNRKENEQDVDKPSNSTIFFKEDLDTGYETESSPTLIEEGGTDLFPKTMCPDMVPNPHVWAILFKLAKIELDFPPMEIIAKRVDGRSFENFFKFNAGGLGYISPDGNHTAYLRVFKAGNDQIRFNLVDELKKGSGKVIDMNTIHKMHLTNQSCVVTAVRDPIERFLSGYNEVEYRREIRVRKGAEGEGPPYTHLGNGTTDRFEQFVRDFLGGPQSAGMYRHKKTGIEEITHVFSMTGILYGLYRIKECGGDEVKLSAYLPSLHNLDEEFPKLLSDTCPGLHQIKSFEKKYTHPSQLDEFGFHSAAKRVWKNEGAMSRALCIIHSLDYACFDSIPIPSICLEVYKEGMFQRNVAQAAARTGPLIPAWVNTRSRHAWAEMLKNPGWKDPACGYGNYA